MVRFNLYPVLRPLVTLLFKLLYRPKIINKELIPKTGAIILAGNHKHAFDPLFIGVCTKRTIHFLAKKELYKGINFLFFDLVGTLPVDKKNKNVKTIGAAEQTLNNGGAIGIFPEGTRNRTDEVLLPFKKGAVRFAMDTNSLIVPFCITGEYKLFKKGLTITIGKPYKIKENDVEKENDKLRKKILNLINGAVKWNTCLLLIRFPEEEKP